METINVQISNKPQFNLVDYVSEYPGVLIAIRNGDPIGMIVFEDDDDYPILMNCNSQKNPNNLYYESIADLIDKNEITELKLIKFS